MEDINIETQDENVRAEIPKMNVFKRIFGVIFSPGKTMEYIAERPGILVPILIVLFSGAVLFLNFPAYSEYMRAAVEKSILQSNQAIDTSKMGAIVNMAAISGAVFIVIGKLFAWVVAGSIFFGIFKIFSAKGRYVHYLSVTGYASIFTVISMLIKVIISYFTGVLDLEKSCTSLAVLADKEAVGNFVYMLMNAFDVFSILQYVVLGIGFAKISKLKPAKAYTIVAVVVIIYISITSIAGAVSLNMAAR